MSIPDIHNCLFLSTENERIRKKYKKLAGKNVLLEKELDRLKEQFRTNGGINGFTKSVQVQTEQRRTAGSAGSVGSQSGSQLNQHTKPTRLVDQQFDKTSKMLTMHNDLMKRYQKELKTNTAQVEQIATLTLENRDMEKKLQDALRKIEQLQKENGILETRIKTVGIKERLTPSKRNLMADLRKVSQERDRLAKERKKFKDELKMLDKGFFEEIEDLKYALQQSARLNNAYEKALKQFCSQFGVPFPTISATTPKQRRRKRTRSHEREFR